MKMSKCNFIMHEARNGLLSIQGLVLCLGKDDKRVIKINKQVARISEAIASCGVSPNKCSTCSTSVEL